MIYCMIVLYKKARLYAIFFSSVPVISVGNLVVGGSGKTPIVEYLAKRYDDIAVVLRGHGRQTKGLLVVSFKGDIKVSVQQSGDEAISLANAIPNSTVIVSEDRQIGIAKAIELGAKVIFLDDGYAKYNIKKFDILIRPKNEPQNIFCLPSGGYKLPKLFYSMADIVIKDGEEFQRVVSFEQNGETIDELPSNTVCITAISKPDRLAEFLPSNCDIKSFYDHYEFRPQDIDNIIKDYPTHTIVTTSKDIHKLKHLLKTKPVLMRLDIVATKSFDIKKIDDYIKGYNYA